MATIRLQKAITRPSIRLWNRAGINARRKDGTIKAHLDFTLVWQQPMKAVRILEIKSCDKIPDEPRDAHVLQAQGQVDLLRHYWNILIISDGVPDNIDETKNAIAAHRSHGHEVYGVGIENRALEQLLDGKYARTIYDLEHFFNEDIHNS